MWLFVGCGLCDGGVCGRIVDLLVLLAGWIGRFCVGVLFVVAVVLWCIGFCGFLLCAVGQWVFGVVVAQPVWLLCPSSEIDAAFTRLRTDGGLPGNLISGNNSPAPSNHR